VIANKLDADRPDDPIASRNLATLRTKTPLPIIAVSAMRGIGITDVTAWLRDAVERVRAESASPPAAAAYTGD